MQQLSMPNLIMRRLADDWKLLLSVFIGITIAVTLAAGTPVYLNALDQLAFNTSLDQLPNDVLDISVSAPNIPLTRKSLQAAEQSIAEAVDRYISEIYVGQETYLKGTASLVGLPDTPLPEGGGTGVLLSRGYLQYLSNVERHSRFIDGRMAGSGISAGEDGPEFEAVIMSKTAGAFNLSVGDVVTLSQALSSATVISAQIVGVLEPGDPEEEYWTNAGTLVDPRPLAAPPPLLVQVDPEEPPVPLFVTQEVLVNILGEWDIGLRLGDEVYLAGAPLLVGLPSRPLPGGGGTGVLLQVGYLQHLSSLEQNSNFREGRVAGDTVVDGPRGPELEAVIPRSTAITFNLSVGDVVPVSPTLGAATLISAKIVGIIDPIKSFDADLTSTGVFARASELGEAPPVLVQLVPDVLALPLMVSREAMVEAVARSYPGTLVKPIWSILVDKKRLKGWTISEARQRLRGFEDTILESMPEASVTTGVVKGLTDVGERRSFFSRVPLLLIMTVVLVTVLIFLSMMVSYLAQSRESDAAMLRSRGVGSLQLLRLYSLEGVVMTGAAVVVAPFLAMAVVALAGPLPFFRELTGGGLLPVVLEPTPFLMAAGTGLLCLAIFVVPGVVGARGGLLLQKLRTSRPPTMPLFQRYYLDVALLVLGGLVFWELHQRGQFVAGGLFQEVEVNETLLLAPVLFLIVVALLFVRLFPLVTRYVSGESLALAHLLVVATVLVTSVAIVARDTEEVSGVTRFGPLALVLAVGVVYLITNLARHPGLRLAGLLNQGVLVAGFLALEPLDPGEVLFGPTIALISIVPGQLAFLLFKASTRASPIWVLMSLWRMSRNPLRYTWLVLLLVLVTGLAILSTTVGGTLERSERERIQYEVAGTLRATFPEFELRNPREARDELGDIPGVTAVSLGFRGGGNIGDSNAEVLALNSRAFSDVSWFREDFSDRPLEDVMGELSSTDRVERIPIPDEANTLGVWVKPLELNPALSMVMELETGSGALETILLGNLRSADWALMSGSVKPSLKRPLHLRSIEIFEPGAFEFGGTPGTILLDDVHATVGPSNEEQVLEDFEGENGWRPIVTAALSSDIIFTTEDDPHGGRRAGAFSFGNEADKGLRGIYRTPTEGPLPIVVSSSLSASTGQNVGDAFLAQIEGRWIPVVIKDVVDYFPTLSPEPRGFILADLDDLLGHLNVLLGAYETKPNELFFKNAPEASEAILEAVRDLAGRNSQIRDGSERLESLRLDPYTTAGWKPMVILSTGIAVLAAAVGYVTYLLLFAKQTGNETGSLLSLGLSRRQLMGLLSFEHLAIAAIGLGLGTWAGFQMSKLMVSPLAVTDAGEPVIPPFLLTTNWSLMLPTYGAFAAVFLAALIVLTRGMARRDLPAMTRMGEA